MCVNGRMSRCARSQMCQILAQWTVCVYMYFQQCGVCGRQIKHWREYIYTYIAPNVTLTSVGPYNLMSHLRVLDHTYINVTSAGVGLYITNVTSSGVGLNIINVTSSGVGPNTINVTSSGVGPSIINVTSSGVGPNIIMSHLRVLD